MAFFLDIRQNIVYIVFIRTKHILNISEYDMKHNIIIKNKNFERNYESIDKIEAGIMLYGVEVKSIINGHVNFVDSYVDIDKCNNIVLKKLHIKKYTSTNNEFVIDVDRDRTLLLHKLEIRRFKRALDERGLTIIPTKIYFKNNKVKVEISLCRGLKVYDKKKKIIDKELNKLAEREIKNKF